MTYIIDAKIGNTLITSLAEGENHMDAQRNFLRRKKEELKVKVLPRVDINDVSTFNEVRKARAMKKLRGF